MLYLLLSEAIEDLVMAKYITCQVLDDKRKEDGCCYWIILKIFLIQATSGVFSSNIQFCNLETNS